MMQFNPKRGWIWRQWRGTVFAETWKSALLNMALATFGVFLYKLYPGLKDMVQGFSILWGQLLSVTTFTLTFFLNQSYGLWRKCYDYSRRLQGRLNDLGMTLAAHATRNKPSSPDVPLDVHPAKPAGTRVGVAVRPGVQPADVRVVHAVAPSDPDAARDAADGGEGDTHAEGTGDIERSGGPGHAAAQCGVGVADATLLGRPSNRRL